MKNLSNVLVEKLVDRKHFLFKCSSALDQARHELSAFLVKSKQTENLNFIFLKL